MNLDANVQKIIGALLAKWKMIVALTLVGIFAAYFITANFTTLTYTSTVEFLAYAVDTKSELLGQGQAPEQNNKKNATIDEMRASDANKMNYAMRMLNTYIEIMGTNEFNTRVVTELNDRINANYSAYDVKKSITIEGIEDTAIFKVTVETSNADLSYEIAHQLETSVPAMMKVTNNGLVNAAVVDKPIKASNAATLNYPKKCVLGGIVGFVLASAYVVLRFLLDVRVKGAEDLAEKFDIPVLGSIPNFEIRSGNVNSAAPRDNVKGVEVNAKK